MTSNPLLSIWTHPRQTVRERLATDPTRFVLLWVVLAGIEQALVRALANASPAPSLAVALIAILVIGPLWGLFALWVTSHLLRWTGQRMSGTASASELRTALAWASVPSAAALLVWVPRLALFGPDILLGGRAFLGDRPGLELVFSLVDLALAAWGAVLLCNTVAEVQGFPSAWSGLGNILFALLILGAIVTVVVVAVGLTVGGAALLQRL